MSKIVETLTFAIIGLMISPIILVCIGVSLLTLSLIITEFTGINVLDAYIQPFFQNLLGI